jgi:hypothetical protein
MPRTPIYDDDCHVGSIFDDDYETFITSPAELYGSFEKMIFPFDTATWMCLCGTLMTAFLVIIIVNRMPKKVQDVFYGENVASPALNVVGLFFNIGLTILPKNNFARFLVIIHSLFCMIINTAYQGEIL